MDMVYMNGEMKEHIKVIGKKEKQKKKENQFLLMVHIMMENLLKEKNQVKVYMFGIKKNIMMKNGKMINEMDMKYIIKIGIN